MAEHARALEEKEPGAIRTSVTLGNQVFAQNPVVQSAHRYTFVRLQQTIGNRAVGRLLQAKLTINQPGDEYEREADHVAEQVMRMPHPATPIQRKCACSQHTIGGDECEECRRRRKSGQIQPPIQTKLTVSNPGDKYEQEADRVADIVMQRPESRLQREMDEEEEELLQTRPLVQRRVSGAEGSSGSPPIVHEVLRSPGQPLHPVTRAFMESRFGHDFSQVRVHTDAKAAESARVVNALAYTVGSQIVFSPGRFPPHSTRNKRLLAHELVHVVQQSRIIRPQLVQRQDLAFGSGFANPFSSEYDEARCGHPKEIGGNPDCRWQPSSDDMSTSAQLSGGGTPVSAFDELLTFIESRGPKSIDRLGIIGHSNSFIFALAGTIDPFYKQPQTGVLTGNVLFDQPAANITKKSIEAKRNRIAKLRERFKPGARIILFGCNAGAGAELLSVIASTFRLCAEGFKYPIQYFLDISTTGGKITKKSTITRGRIQSGEIMERFELWGLMNKGMFITSVWKLTPDSGLYCYSGTPEQTEEVLKLADEARQSPERAGFYAPQFMQRILGRYFRTSASILESAKTPVYSLAYDDTITGLLVRPHRKGKKVRGEFYIGTDFIKKITQEELPLVLAAIQRALTAIEQWSIGPDAPLFRHFSFK